MKFKVLARLRSQRQNAADKMAGLTAAAKTGGRDLTVDEAQQFDAHKKDAEQLDAEIAELDKLPESAFSAQPTPAPAVTDPELLRKEGARAEQSRVTQITDRVQAARLAPDVATEMIKNGVSVEDATRQIFAKMSEADQKRGTQPPPAITADARDKQRHAMTAGLLHRIDPKGFPLKDGLGKEFAGLTLMELGRESLEAVGVKTRGMQRLELATASLMGIEGRRELLAGGMMGTSDLPNVLADVANKTLRQGYQAAPRTFLPFSRRITATDFKNINSIQLSDIAKLEKVNENGEFKYTNVADSKEMYKLSTYGNIFRLTRQALINDDISAIGRIPLAFGIAAARLENETVWGVITANAAMADNIAIFHANHSNLLSGAGSALALAGLSSSRAAMRKQTAPKGQILNITARYLCVPAALETTGAQLVAPAMLAASQASNTIPEWIRQTILIVEPLLDANSATAWYMFGEPSQIDTVEYAYLAGEEGVYIESRNGFEVDGVEIKAREDFGAACVEYRGMQKNAGV